MKFTASSETTTLGVGLTKISLASTKHAARGSIAVFLNPTVVASQQSMRSSAYYGPMIRGIGAALQAKYWDESTLYTSWPFFGRRWRDGHHARLVG
jgi:hypothetical protein